MAVTRWVIDARILLVFITVGLVATSSGESQFVAGFSTVYNKLQFVVFNVSSGNSSVLSSATGALENVDSYGVWAAERDGWFCPMFSNALIPGNPGRLINFVNASTGMISGAPREAPYKSIELLAYRSQSDTLLSVGLSLNNTAQYCDYEGSKCYLHSFQVLSPDTREAIFSRDFNATPSSYTSEVFAGPAVAIGERLQIITTDRDVGPALSLRVLDASGEEGVEVTLINAGISGFSGFGEAVSIAPNHWNLTYVTTDGLMLGEYKNGTWSTELLVALPESASGLGDNAQNSGDENQVPLTQCSDGTYAILMGDPQMIKTARLVLFNLTSKESWSLPTGYRSRGTWYSACT